jgi:hypothetical protein
MNLPLKHFLDGIFLDRVPGLSAEVVQKARVSEGEGRRRGEEGGKEKRRNRGDRIFPFLQLFLVDVLMARLTVTTPPLSSSTPFQLYGSRHKWLDSLPPFDGSSPKPSQVVLQDLMQLQALLCSSCQQTKQSGHVTCSADLMTAVASHCEGCIVEGMVGELSLLLLTWPHTGQLQQVRREGGGRGEGGGRD